VLAILLCAAPLLMAAPAPASQRLVERQAVREALRLEARSAATGGVAALPLPAAGAPAASVASAGELELAEIAGPVRVLIGVRSHADLPGVAGALEQLGARPEAFEPLGVLAARVPSGAALAAALGGDPRVAYIERDSELQLAADPFDTVDPLIGLKYTWYYDEVRAGEALAAAGGGSRRSIAVMDTGLDVGHPEFAGRITRTFDTATRGSDVTDAVGHGTFVTGLIAAIDGNGIGIKGVAGNTRVLAVRGSSDGGFMVTDLLRGIDFAIRRGADIINLSLAGGENPETPTIARALAVAFLNDVLPVAASGNKGDTASNPLQYPAAVLGGRRGKPGIGLSVAATKPDGQPAAFSTHNKFVSLAAPGAGFECTSGVLSTLPAAGGTIWDVVEPGTCPSRLFTDGGARFGYGEGTSFAAPIVSGIAALTWQVEPRLASEQVAEVLLLSARQTLGTGWNRYTGWGIVDGQKAAELARAYDVVPPRVKGRASRSGQLVTVRLRPTKDRTERGRELAGHVTYGLLVSRDGGRDFDVLVSRRKRPFRTAVALRGTRANVFVATACDGNGNCGVKRLGRFRRG
jgi:subtilisin family serine protease